MITELRKELEKLKYQSELLDRLAELSDSEFTDKISKGCRVKINYENSESQYGRVISLSRDRNNWLVSRDGYAGTIRVADENLEPVYTGIRKHVDVQLWDSQVRIRELETIIVDAGLPTYFRDKKIVNIRVVSKCEPKYGYCFISCEIHHYDQAQIIKVPHSLVEMNGYYQLHIKDEDIYRVIPISREKYLKLE